MLFSLVPSSTRLLYRSKTLQEFERSRMVSWRRFFSINVKRPVLTLIPEKMEGMGQHVIDLSRRRMPTLYNISPHPTTSSRIIHVIYKTEPGSTLHQPFPEGTTGLLYYHQPPGLPEISGGLRFRLCPSVTHFSKGKDLEIDFGEPWHVPLYCLIRMRFWRPLWPLLLPDRLVDDQLISDVRELPRSGRIGGSRVLYEIDQTFILDLQQPALSLVLMNRKNLSTIVLQCVTEDRRNYPGFQPYDGKVLVKFELSKLEVHLKTPTLVLRVLDALTPIRCVVPGKYDLFVAPPTPGQLISKRRSTGNTYKPWALPLNVRSKNKRRIAEFLQLPQEQTPTSEMPAAVA